MTNTNKQSIASKYPTKYQLSLCGLAADNPDAAGIADLAVLRLRRLAKKSAVGSIPWHEATRIADSELLSKLHNHGRIQLHREASPWVIYVVR